VTQFTVCILMYGDHVDLARRCLGSIVSTLDPAHVASIRVGLNEVCGETRRFVETSLARLPVDSLIYLPERNVMKYPLMRRMFWDTERPITTPHIMWFDDDSCITADRSWWARVADAATRAHQLGDVWTVWTRGNQSEGITAQPWYRGKPLLKRHKLRFATGGWWVLNTDVMRRANYPWPELRHRGGDSPLGEFMRQQGLTLAKFKDGLWINADNAGGNSKAARRGHDERPMWVDYSPGQPTRLDHHDFNCRVYRT
jgi:hypothetical protein